MGIFRIAKAEFIKIFKKPSVYIMGAVLALSIVLSLFFFTPSVRTEYKLNIAGNSVLEMYTNFVENEDADAKETLKTYSDKLTSSKNEIVFYEQLSNISEVLNKNLQKIKTAYGSYINYYNLNKANSKKEYEDKAIAAANETIAAINELYNNFKELNPELESAALVSENEKAAEGKIDVSVLVQYPIYSDYFLQSAFYKNSLSNIENFKNNKLQNITIGKDNIDSLKNAFESEKFNENVVDYLLKNIDNIFKASLIANFEKITLDGENFIANLDLAYNYNILAPLLKNLNDSISNFNKYIEAIINRTSNYIAFINNNDYTNTKKVLEEITNTIDEITKESNKDTQYNKCLSIKNILTNNKTYKTMEEIINKMVFVSLTQQEIDTVKIEFFNIATNNLNTVKNELTNYKSENGNETVDKHKQAFNNIAVKAVLLNNYYSNFINNKILLSVTKNLSSYEVQAFKDSTLSKVLSNYNYYSLNENIAKTTYLLKNNVYDVNYLNPFAFNANSGFKTNLYDFMYFSLRISTIFLIIFGITMAANLIAMEYENGTIKLLAIRPYKRYKLITGKMFATMFFVLIFILFAFLISFIAGIAVYPTTLTMTSVLTVFNGSNVLLINPLVLMFINLISIIFEVLFYVIIAVAISTIFKSFAGAISCSLILYIVGFVLNIFLGNMLWYAFMPFVNLDFYKFFGGAFIADRSNMFASMLTSPVLSNMSFFISIAIYASFIAISLVVTYLAFRRKEF